MRSVCKAYKRAVTNQTESTFLGCKKSSCRVQARQGEKLSVDTHSNDEFFCSSSGCTRPPCCVHAKQHDHSCAGSRSRNCWLALIDFPDARSHSFPLAVKTSRLFVCWVKLKWPVFCTLWKVCFGMAWEGICIADSQCHVLINYPCVYIGQLLPHQHLIPQYWHMPCNHLTTQ